MFIRLIFNLVVTFEEKFQKIQLQAHNNNFFDLEFDFWSKFQTQMDHLDSYAKNF